MTLDRTETGGGLKHASVGYPGYLLDDWRDGKLNNRDNFAERRYYSPPSDSSSKVFGRPEWLVLSGSPSITERLVIVDDDAFYGDFPTSIDQTVTWEFSVDLSESGDEGVDDFYAGLYAGGNTRPDNKALSDSYSIRIRGDGGVSILKESSDGSQSSFLNSSWSGAMATFTVTRTSSGEWELFVDGSSQGTNVDTEFSAPNYIFISAREDADVTAKVDWMKVY